MTEPFSPRRWVPEIHRNLTHIISSSPGIACFDFDNTLIYNDFGEKLMEAVVTDGMPYLPDDLSPYFRNHSYWKEHRNHPSEEKAPLVWEEYTYHLKEFGIEAGYRWTSFLFQGMTKEEFYDFSQANWAKVSEQRTEDAVFPQPELLDLIAYLQAKNWVVYIVTASPEFGIAAISQHFSIPESQVIGMKLALTPDGRTLPKIIEPYTYGKGKVDAILSRIGSLPDLAFGDSFNDFPMLCSAKRKAVAMDKGNPEFVEACLKEGILIQPFLNHES